MFVQIWMICNKWSAHVQLNDCNCGVICLPGFGFMLWLPVQIELCLCPIFDTLIQLSSFVFPFSHQIHIVWSTGLVIASVSCIVVVK